MMDESIKISVAYEFREYKIDKRDNKRIRFLSFSSVHGDLKIELPYGSIITKEYEWRRKGDRKYQEPDMKEILQHCKKMAEDGNDLIEDTFKDIIENIDDEMEIMIDGIPREWEEIKEMLLDETIDELEY